MSLLDAVIRVLQDAGEPLHAKDITALILNRGLWHTNGKTPAATVSARLYTEIKNNGEASAFFLHAPQTFGLRVSPPPKKTEATEKVTCSFTDAAEKVLSANNEKQPMHYRLITEKALADGWLVTSGKTPEATMYAQILTEIKRRELRGEQARFVKHGNGLVGLTAWLGQGPVLEISRHNQKVRENLHKRLRELDPYGFEELIGRLLAEMGFEEIEITRKHGDGGIDVRGTLVVGDVIRTHMAIQVKRRRQNVQRPIVQQVRGSLGPHEQGLIITTSDFSAGAREDANRPDLKPVGLMNGETLVLLLMEHGIGVSRSRYDLFEQADFTGV